MTLNRPGWLQRVTPLGSSHALKAELQDRLEITATLLAIWNQPASVQEPLGSRQTLPSIAFS